MFVVIYVLNSLFACLRPERYDATSTAHDPSHLILFALLLFPPLFLFVRINRIESNPIQSYNPMFTR